jgi:hypothetical protein
MRRAAALATTLLLAGCATGPTWWRIDGTAPDPQQGQIDIATCHAMAMNAANGIPMPAPASRVTVDNSVTVNSPGSTMPPPPSPGQWQGPEMDFSGMAGIGANLRRRQTHDAYMDACMAQRGYRAQ